MADFLIALEEDTEPMVSGQRNLPTIRAILAEDESARSGGEWVPCSGFGEEINPNPLTIYGLKVLRNGMRQRFALSSDLIGGSKMAETMTPRERWFAALKCEPVDRLPFWPKIHADTYAPYQKEPFRSMKIGGLYNNIGDLHKWIGSDPHVFIASCVKTVRKKTSTRSLQENGIRITEYITPAGTLTAASKYSKDSRSWHPVEFPVKRREDIQAMSLFYSDATCEFDSAQFDQASAAMGRIGIFRGTTTKNLCGLIRDP